MGSVRGKCNVMLSEPTIAIPDILSKIRNKQHVYICRYKIVNTKGKLSLVPIDIVNKNSVQTENIFAGSDSEIDKEPVKVLKSSNSHNSSGAQRNLNASFMDAGDNVLMGSIEDSPDRNKDDLKLTIKVTRKEKYRPQKCW